ncbi:MAG TPA: tRNA-dihydrouridine synthase, partial [Patescibacteria group bacterium]|nr:tRNA-dihydrouridine synthase [Patescibacteria group bacterium]
MSNFWKKLPKPFFVLAPMENVTDFAFREVVATELPKPDVLFTEFTNVEALTSKGYEKTIPRFKFSKNQRPIVAQIWGNKPELFYKVAQMVQKLGFDGIDINMGCPDRTVVKNGGGAGMINTPSLAKEVIEAVKKGAKKLPISVKTRIGVKEIVTEKWITFLLEQKIDTLTIHGRTARQMSEGLANWEEISKAVKIRDRVAPNTLIIGNGDVKDYSEAIEKVQKHGLDGIMIARGIFANPWIFEPIRTQHSKQEYIKVLLKHLDLYEKEHGLKRGLDPMKKFFKMYINNFPGASKLRQKLMLSKTYAEVREILVI